MESRRAPRRHPSIVATTALAGALGLAGCGVLSPGMTTQESAPSTSTAEAVSPQPEATAGPEDPASAGYTVEDVQEAVALVGTTGSSLNLIAGDRVDIQDHNIRSKSRLMINGAVVEPAECAQHHKDGAQFALDYLQHPFVFASGDEERLLVRAMIFPTAEEAARVAALGAPPQDDLCREYTIGVEESAGSYYRRTHRRYEVDLPKEFTQVSAATNDITAWGLGYDFTERHSEVNAVADNVWVTVEYGVQKDHVDSPDEAPMPLQAERAAAELAAQQVLTALLDAD